MTDIYPPEDYGALLTTKLAELADRLRQSSSRPAPDRRVPAATARLEVAAALLAQPGVLTDPGSLPHLGVALKGLLEVIRDDPGRVPAHLEPALELLAQVLESALGLLDDGETAATIIGDPIWLAVLSRLENAGSPLEIMDEFDACARRWEAQWCDRDLSRSQEEALHRRWQVFRDYGDAMFGPVVEEGDSPAKGNSPIRSLVLLVESILRRDQLLRRLHEAGFEVWAAAGVEETLTRIESSAGEVAILCDDLEPSRHLLRLVEQKENANHGGCFFPPLVLVTTGSGNAIADQQRAQGLGAEGAWTEPFRIEPLTRIFSGWAKCGLQRQRRS